jgi:hypothetical protein
MTTSRAEQRDQDLQLAVRWGSQLRRRIRRQKACWAGHSGHAVCLTIRGCAGAIGARSTVPPRGPAPIETGSGGTASSVGWYRGSSGRGPEKTGTLGRMQQRWGTLSVVDHQDILGLIPDVLLYDRLVFPVPVVAVRADWPQKWDLPLLEERLAQLGPLAVQENWTPERQDQFTRRWTNAKQIGHLADDLIEHDVQMRTLPRESRWRLTQDILAENVTPPPDVDHVVAVAAYRSERDFQRDVPLREARAERHETQAELAFLLGHRLAVPKNTRNPHDALSEAIQLSRDNARFQERRRKLYEWQNDQIRTIAEEGMLPEKAVNEMEQLVNDYNRCVEQATKERWYKFAFTVAAVAISLAGAALTPLSAGGAFLAFAKFAKYDMKLNVQAGEAEAAAMFHDVSKLRAWR